MVVIRSFRDEDEEPIAGLLNDREVSVNLRDRVPHPYTLDDARQFLAMVRDAEREWAWAIEVDGEIAGSVGLQPKSDVYRKTAELGFWLGRPFWGRGVGTAVVATMRRWAFEEWPIVRLEAEVFGWNEASRRVLEKAGFEREATLRQAVTKEGKGTADLWIYSVLGP